MFQGKRKAELYLEFEMLIAYLESEKRV